MSRNAITDVAGVLVGQAEDRRIASGVTAVIFERPCVASVSIAGGAPGGRDTALLEPGMSVEAIDALVLSGGSAFGLDGWVGSRRTCGHRAGAFASAMRSCRSCPAPSCSIF